MFIVQYFWPKRNHDCAILCNETFLHTHTPTWASFEYIIKSPQYTGGDFIVLYRFVRRRRRRRRRRRLRRRPQILVHAITFEHFFLFLSFWAQLLALTCRLPDYILVDFRHYLDLDFSRSNMEFAISQSKMVRLPWNEKQAYRLNSRAQMWPSGLTLAMTLTLNFQGQIQNLLYLSQKWSDCHETKSKHIDWTLGLKCGHRVWPWPWPWPWIFKVKYRICFISAKNGPIATKRKANILIELQTSNVTNGFELDHNLDLWILKLKCDLDLLPHRWPWLWIFMVKFWKSCISEWEGWLTLHKGGGSRSVMTMIMTIWWPRSGVWIYQEVTGVTSVVAVPSTHLVFCRNGTASCITILKWPSFKTELTTFPYVNPLFSSDIISRHWTWPTLVLLTACYQTLASDCLTHSCLSSVELRSLLHKLL